MHPLIFHVEDEMDIVWATEYRLKREGFRTRFASTGLSALSMINQGILPDLVLLDLMLPDICGLEVCRKLRKNPETRNIPILMLTAKEEELDRLAGFEAGADDYLVKPFSMRELMHRIRALLRRGSPQEIQEEERQETEKPGSPSYNESMIRAGLVVDRATRRVWVDGVEVVTTDEEYQTCCDLLIRNTPTP